MLSSLIFMSEITENINLEIILIIILTYAASFLSLMNKSLNQVENVSNASAFCS